MSLAENMRTKIAIGTVGCKLNQSETELITRRLTEAGYQVVTSVDEADIYVLNTCTVTHIADSKSRHMLRLAHRRNPEAQLVAIGCYAERASQELAQIEGVKLVLGNMGKTQLVKQLHESIYFKQPCSSNTQSDYFNDGSRTRAFIKIQDGCRNYCSYCIVPLVRNTELSVPTGTIIAEVNHRVDSGCQEIVLTGTKIGVYYDNGIDLVGLITRVLEETTVERVRLSSLQPQEISPRLLGLWQNGRLCRHFHLSLQSGSDHELRRMRRMYSVADYVKAVGLIREIIPEVAITTDVIVGFPGETEREFQETYNLCQQIGFSRIHVFQYSIRSQTEAANMLYKVTARVKKERSQQMLMLAKQSTYDYTRKFIGETTIGLWEKKSGNTWSGLTDNYIRIFTRSKRDLTNKLLTVELVEIYRDGMWGRLED